MNAAQQAALIRMRGWLRSFGRNENLIGPLLLCADSLSLAMSADTRRGFEKFLLTEGRKLPVFLDNV
jgi:hypothetical protein